VGYKVASGLFRRGVLISGTLTNAQTIRIEPPLVIEYDEIDETLNRLEDTLKSISSAPVSGETTTLTSVEIPAIAAAAPAPVAAHATGSSEKRVSPAAAAL
jgi:putrescine aminotransferase